MTLLVVIFLQLGWASGTYNKAGRSLSSPLNGNKATNKVQLPVMKIYHNAASVTIVQTLYSITSI